MGTILRKCYKESFNLLFGPSNHPKAKRSTARDDDDIVPTNLWIKIVNAHDESKKNLNRDNFNLLMMIVLRVVMMMLGMM